MRFWRAKVNCPLDVCFQAINTLGASQAYLEQPVGLSSDVYAFAIDMWEVLADRKHSTGFNLTRPDGNHGSSQ